MYKWKQGYCSALILYCDYRRYEWLRSAALQCKWFVLGIPGKPVVDELLGDSNCYDVDAVRDYWMQYKWITDVVILEEGQLSYQEAYERFHFDVCFAGSEYGLGFEKDKSFLEEKGVDFVPLLPERLTIAEDINALQIWLRNISAEKKIVLFGTGTYFEYYIRKFGFEFKPIYAIDNAEEKWDTKRDNIVIYNPEKLKQENPEEIAVIICSKSYRDMLQQLRKMGSFDYRLLLFRNDAAVLEAWEKLWKNVKQSREQKHRRLLESFKNDRLKDLEKELEKKFQVRFI